MAPLLPAVLALSFALTAFGLPAPQAASSGVWAGPAGDDESDGGPPLRGSLSLQGSVADEVSPSDSAVVPTNAYALAPGQTDNARIGVPLDFTNAESPQPLRGDLGATDPGPRTYAYDRLNPDTLAPPGSDKDVLPQAVWPMGLSHNRLLPGRAGWARQQNTNQLPIATAMAGVDMRLAPNAYRELHWHQANEWALVLNGSVRVQTLDEDGQTFVDDLHVGDVWFFPAGLPHSLQALAGGCEFLLVFDDGAFSDSDTSLASELALRTPLEVLGKNLAAPLEAFADLPRDELYIFNGTPAPANISAQNVTGPGGVATGNQSYTYHFSKQEPYEVPGGSIKILDPATFPIASMFSVALVTIKPGAMREIHWWGFFLSGRGRVGVYVAPSSGQTVDVSAGSVSYVPKTASHYIENTGDEDIVFLEVLQAPRFSDVSVNQWLRLTPRQIVRDTLHLPDRVLDNLSPDKQYVVQGKNFTG